MKVIGVTGNFGTGKSTVCRDLGARLIKIGWRVAYCDTPDQPHPAGAARVRDVDHALKLMRPDFSRWFFIHCEAHRANVARKDRAHPWLVDRVHEYRHGGPGFLLASQFPYEMDLEIRRAAKDGTFLLYMGTAANLEFVKRNFDEAIFEKVRAWRDPNETHELKCIGPVKDGGRE